MNKGLVTTGMVMILIWQSSLTTLNSPLSYCCKAQHSIHLSYERIVYLARPDQAAP